MSELWWELHQYLWKNRDVDKKTGTTLMLSFKSLFSRSKSLGWKVKKEKQNKLHQKFLPPLKSSKLKAITMNKNTVLYLLYITAIPISSPEINESTSNAAASGENKIFSKQETTVRYENNVSFKNH